MSAPITAFHIALGPRTLGQAYSLHASCAGAEQAGELDLPAPLRLAVERLASAGALPLAEPATLGRALGRALLAPALRTFLLQNAQAAARAGRRFQIQLQIAPPELALLPWEWLTLGAERPWSPALRADYPLVRVSRSLVPPAPAQLAGPLRVLAVAAPSEQLQLAALQSALAPAIRTGTVELHLIDNAAPATLEQALRAGPVHVLHCAAPVAHTERGMPRLLLRRGLDLFDLAALLADAAQLRLLLLAGPQGDAGMLGALLPTMAAALLAPGLPATIAFGGALPARLAGLFAATCYGELAAGQPIDLAVTSGRRALAHAGDGRGWGMPQLRTAPGAGQLFVQRSARRHPASANTLQRTAAEVLPRRDEGTKGARRVGQLPHDSPFALFHPSSLRGYAGRLFSSRRTMRRAAVAGGGLALLGALYVGAQIQGRPARRAEPILAAGPTASPPLRRALALAQPSSPTPPPTATPTSLPAPIGYATLLARPGDTLAAIAERMGSEAAAIAQLNRLDPSQPLRADYPLAIPIYRPAEPGAGGLVIRHANPAARKVALTFDIEIDDATLYQILEILRQRGLHGTFFVTGRWALTFPDAARAIVNEGHEIANHSLTHPYFSRIGPEGAAAELARTEQIIHEITSASARPYFRFPYGDFSPTAAEVVAQAGYVAYHWSADDPAIPGWLDWAGQHSGEAGGSILLMHGRAETVAALPGWLDRLAALGLAPTTLGDALR